jgi:protein gp37
VSTAIEWTDETWNPVVGCTQISKGCGHCYAKQIHDNRHKAALAGKAVHPQYLKPFEHVQLMPERLTRPLHWRKPRRTFVNSVSDLFHEDVPDEFLDKVFAIMQASPRHTFQVLTKRPARMQDYVAGAELRVEAMGEALAEEMDWCHANEDAAWPLPNVWLGVSVENQEAADDRISLLQQTPAAIRFLSCEPLLGPVDLTEVAFGTEWSNGEERPARVSCLEASAPVVADGHLELAGIDWVIVGGESGAKARPCDVEWITLIVADCDLNGVPCFVKQLGAVPIESEQTWRAREFARVLSVKNRKRVPEGFVGWAMGDKKGGDPLEWPLELRVRQFPGEAVPA